MCWHVDIELTARRQPSPSPVSAWHAPHAVVAGSRHSHMVELNACSCCRWVRCLAFDHGNEWFVTGSADRTIKVGVADKMTPADGVCQPCLSPIRGEWLPHDQLLLLLTYDPTHGRCGIQPAGS
jgi:WD40 repeat protein